ncbi:MAG: cupin domain-containing protein [Bacillaceae bacterium]|nr:cupin domain-containing protein [Bacillaceae bacterium]
MAESFYLRVLENYDMVDDSKYKVVHISEVEASEVKEGGAEKTWVKWLISKDDGAPNFAMRLFEVEPGGRTPLHDHPWEHEVFILDGKCKLVLGDEEKILEAGYAIYVPPNLRHSFINVGERTLRFLCLIPIRKS